MKHASDYALLLNGKYPEILTKKGELKQRYASPLSNIITILKNGEKVLRVHPNSWAYNRGKFKPIDNSQPYIDFCNSVGITYKRGNDAPRGGLVGDYIDISLDGRKAFIKDLKGVL